MAGLRLEVQDFADLTRWQWLLADELLVHFFLITRCGSTRATGSSGRSVT